MVQLVAHFKLQFNINIYFRINNLDSITELTQQFLIVGCRSATVRVLEANKFEVLFDLINFIRVKAKNISVKFDQISFSTR